MFKKPILTIDGPAASGKGTVAKKIAQDFNLYYLETGIFYRLLAFEFISLKTKPKNFKCFLKDLNINFLERTDTSKKNLYKVKVSNFASILAQEKLIRNFVVKQQKTIINKYPSEYAGIILDGRDCGTVIAPQADLKIFMTASLSTRCERRLLQMKENSEVLNYEEVYNDLKTRDNRDKQRKLSPLIKAEGSSEIDTTNFSLQEMINVVKKLIFSKIPYLKIKI